MYFIGVDLGTSAVKLLLMDEEGKIVNIVSREYPLYFPHPGWSEQKPEDWWEQSKEGIRDLVKDVDKSQVAGISFGGQMHGLVILDENDNVIRPAILWNDGRTAKQTDYLNTVIGKEKLSEYTANIAFAGFTAPKILWVKENEPDNFAKICKIMLPKDYLAYRLSGAFVSDYSDASGMLLMDVKNKCWSKEMAEICGISLEMLPELHESFDAVGTLKPEVAAELGLPETCKVVAGAGDNAAAAVGTGTVGDGMCNVSLGTSGTVFISSNKFGVDSHNALHAFAHADGHYHLMGCMLSAASCNKWWMDEIIRTKEYTKEQENITKLGSMVSVTRTIFSAASSTDEKTPQATAASMAPPSAGPSSDSIRSTLMFSTFAIMRLHSGLFAPPPQIFVLSIWMPRDFATSKESRIAKATPSRTAWVISSLVVSIVRPMKVPLASGLLCGERSPIRYGRKKTLFV